MTTGLAFEERDGFQFPREAAMAEATFRREEREFEQQCNRLYARQWAANKRAANPEQARAAKRAYIDSHRDLIRNHERERSRRRRRGEKLQPVLNACLECGGTWEALQLAQFCSHRCNKRFHYVPRRPFASVRVRLVKFLRAHPDSTAREAWEALDLKPATTLSWFQHAYQAGLVTFTQKGRRRYRLLPPSSPIGVGEWTLRAAANTLMRAA